MTTKILLSMTQYLLPTKKLVILYFPNKDVFNKFKYLLPYTRMSSYDRYNTTYRFKDGSYQGSNTLSFYQYRPEYNDYTIYEVVSRNCIAISVKE